jgi:MYXO-CTERM domain-containing protein
MKKILLTVALAATAVLSYGQGTIGFNNGLTSRHTWINAAGVNQGNITSNQAVHVGIFVGADAGSLRMMPEMPLAEFRVGNAAGVATLAAGGTVYAIPGFAQGERPFAQVRLWSTSKGADWQTSMMTLGDIFGQTDIRQINALAAPAGPGTAIWQAPTGTNPALFRPIVAIEIVPEPSTWALGAIGVGALWLLRRRKAS